MAMRSSQIRERVLAALNEDARTSDAIIEVVDDSGVVTLRGTVESKETRQAAAEIAEKQEGVISVTNTLQVDSDASDDPSPLIVPPPMQNQ